MKRTSREEILEKLRMAPRGAIPPRPGMPLLRELSLDREGMIVTFTEKLRAEEGIVYRVGDHREAVARLTALTIEEGLQKVFASTDEVVAQLDLPGWGKEQGITVYTADDFSDCDSFRDTVFDDVQAGITGADYAVAETGTIVIAHDVHQPRLVSLAPILHIALVPVTRLFAVYEQVVDEIYGRKEDFPSQVSFITGPSMTGDIQGIPFKGMHGPRRLIVILVG